MRDWQGREMDGSYAMVFMEDNADALKLKLLKQEAEIRFLKQDNAELRFKLCKAERMVDELQRQQQGGQLASGEEKGQVCAEAKQSNSVVLRETTDKSQLRSCGPLHATDTASCATESGAKLLGGGPGLVGEAAELAVGKRTSRPAVAESPGRVSISDSSSEHLRDESEGTANEGEGECMERAGTASCSRPPQPNASSAEADLGERRDAMSLGRVGGARMEPSAVVASHRQMLTADVLVLSKAGRGAPEAFHTQGASPVTGETRSRVLSMLQAKCREISTKQQQQQGSIRRARAHEKEVMQAQPSGMAEDASAGPGAAWGGAGQGIPLGRDPGRLGPWMGTPGVNRRGGAAPLGAGLSLGLPLGHGEVLSQHRARLNAGGVLIGQRLPAVLEEGDSPAEDLSLKLPESPMMSSQSGGSTSLARSRHSSPLGMSPRQQTPGATGFPAGYQEALQESLSQRTSRMPPTFLRASSADQPVPQQDTAAMHQAQDVLRDRADGAEAEQEDKEGCSPTCRLTLALTTPARDSVHQVKEEESESPPPSMTPPRDVAATSGAVHDASEPELDVAPVGSAWGPLRGGMGRGAGLPRRPSGVPGKGHLPVQLPPIGQAQMTLDSLVSKPGVAALRSGSSMSSAAAAASAASKLMASLDGRKASVELSTAAGVNAGALAPSSRVQAGPMVLEHIGDGGPLAAQRPLSVRLKELGSRKRSPELDPSLQPASDSDAGVQKAFPAPAWPLTKVEDGGALACSYGNVTVDVAGLAGAELHGTTYDAGTSQGELQPSGHGISLEEGERTGPVARAAEAVLSHNRHDDKAAPEVQSNMVNHDDSTVKAESGQHREAKKGSAQNQELLALRLLTTCRAAGAGKGQGSVPVRRPVIGEPAAAMAGPGHQHVIRKLMATRTQRLAARSGAHQELETGLSLPSSMKDLGGALLHGAGARPSLVDKLRGAVRQDHLPAKRVATGAACKSFAALDAASNPRAFKRVKTEPDGDLVLSMPRDR